MDYNQQYANLQQPSNYKTWSIVNLAVSIFFCCSCVGIISLVLSIIALMKSNEVDRLLQMGDEMIASAKEASNMAKTLNIISSILLALGAISTVAYLLIYGLASITQAFNNF